jgi:hypothetical protein
MPRMNENLQRLNPAGGGNPLRNAEHVASMLKLMAHPHRLMLLCLLSEGQRSVSELADILGISQTTLSNHLTKLRDAKLVDYNRYHRILEYRLAAPEAQTILDVLSGMCLNRSPKADSDPATPAEAPAPQCPFSADKKQPRKP